MTQLLQLRQLLLSHLWRHLCASQNLYMVQASLPLLPPYILNSSWYSTRSEKEVNRLLYGTPDGTFMVRGSNSQSKK
jgi:hypothetical protein